LPGPLFPWYQIIPTVELLVPEPSGEGCEAWYCKGGCDEKGQHHKLRKAVEVFPSLIGFVKKAGREP
jgi:hypothetical protein